MSRKSNAAGSYTAASLTLTDGDEADLQLDASGNLKIVGGQTSGSTAGTETNVVGGVFQTTNPSLSNGQAGQNQLTSSGNQKVSLFSDFTTSVTTATDGNADARGAAIFALTTGSLNFLHNGSSFDRERGNQEATLLASAARTTTQTGADIINYNGDTSLIVVLDMTTVGTGSVTLSIEGKDTASGKYYTILTGAAVTTNSTNRYRVSPDLASAANSIAQDVLPRIIRIVVAANNANSATYSVGYCLVGR